MIDFHFAELAKLVIGFVLALLQSDAAAVHGPPMVAVGDRIDGMTLAIGAGDAQPLWAFCASEVDGNNTTADCRVPQFERLAIGHAFLGGDDVFKDTAWSDLDWQLYIDDQLVDLHSFGTYDYVLPTMAPNPSLVKEVFMRFTAWDVVLTNLQAGEHVLEGYVSAGSEEHTWVVNLIIEGDAVARRNPQRKGLYPQDIAR